MDNEHEKLFVISSKKGANLCRKCTETRLAAGLRADLLGWGAYASPELLCCKPGA